MKIEHLAIWVHDLELMKEFYGKYFGARAGEKYSNPKKEFESYFLTLEEGARIELMKKSGIDKSCQEELIGFAHVAISVGSKSTVDQLTQRLRADGFTVTREPRTTGDGYYESVIEDPEGNRVEITV
jgi:lactoylglutathione lyase